MAHPTPNLNLPRFRDASFATAYPFGRVVLSRSGRAARRAPQGVQPAGAHRCRRQQHPAGRHHRRLRNAARAGDRRVCAQPAELHRRRWLGDDEGLEGRSAVRRREAEPQHGCATATAGRRADVLGRRRRLARGLGHHRASRRRRARACRDGRRGYSGRWGVPLLDFWDDFSADGALDAREGDPKVDTPVASLAVEGRRAAGRDARRHVAAGVALPEPLHVAAARTRRRGPTTASATTTRRDIATRGTCSRVKRRGSTSLRTRTVAFVSAFAAATCPPK